MQTGSVIEARQAADIWPWEPAYLLRAGRALMSHGQSRESQVEIREGRGLVQRAVEIDPSNPAGYADLARMDMSVMALTAAAAQLRAGLEWNPHHPTLQGLWAYAALQAQRRLEDDSLTLELIDGLRRLPVDTPDGWFWLSAAYEERHDTAAAESARERARALAPKLDTDACLERLR